MAPSRLTQLVGKLSNAAQQAMTESIIQQDRAEQMELRLSHKNAELRRRGRKKLTTIVATTRAEIRKLRDEMDKKQNAALGRKAYVTRTPRKRHVSFATGSGPRRRQVVRISSSESSTSEITDSGSDVSSIGSTIHVYTPHTPQASINQKACDQPRHRATPGTPTPSLRAPRRQDLERQGCGRTLRPRRG